MLRTAAAGAEFCGFATRGRDTVSGAARLGPPAPYTPPVEPGDGVRIGETFRDDEGPEQDFEFGDATFLLRGSLLTVQMKEPLERSTVTTILCARGGDEGTSKVAFRNVVVGRGRRVVTGDIGPVRADADFCLIEDAIIGGDVAVAYLDGATPTAPETAPSIKDRPPGPRPVIAAGKGKSPSKLQVQTLRPGRGGRRSRDGDELTTHYAGASFSDGVEFDASWARGEPFSFNLGAGQVIEGWDRGLRGMRVGERRRIVIPPRLAYGEQGSPPTIRPSETLIFVVDLVRIRRR